MSQKHIYVVPRNLEGRGSASRGEIKSIFAATDLQVEFFQRRAGYALFQAFEKRRRHNDRMYCKFQALEIRNTFKKVKNQLRIVHRRNLGKSESKMFQTFVFFQVAKELRTNWHAEILERESVFFHSIKQNKNNDSKIHIFHCAYFCSCIKQGAIIFDYLLLVFYAKCSFCTLTAETNGECQFFQAAIFSQPSTKPFHIFFRKLHVLQQWLDCPSVKP